MAHPLSSHMESPQPKWQLFGGILAAVLILVVSVAFLFFRSPKEAQKPTVLLVGPSGAGKTALFTRWKEASVDEKELLQNEFKEPESSSHVKETVISLSPNTSQLALSPRVALVDTPGHEKLAQHFKGLMSSSDLKAILYVIDAANGADSIRAAAKNLMLVLETAERRQIPVLLAANKYDQFNSLSVAKVKSLLEYEIEELRSLKSRTVQSSENGDDSWEHIEFLGIDGKHFEFSDLDVEVAFLDGSVTAGTLQKWEDWLQEYI